MMQDNQDAHHTGLHQKRAYTRLGISSSYIYVFLLFCGVRIECQDTQCVHQRSLVLYRNPYMHEEETVKVVYALSAGNT